jgi:putative toxin-antitoxin system antitoxin component (TIGR02293 family)
MNLQTEVHMTTAKMEKRASSRGKPPAKAVPAKKRSKVRAIKSRSNVFQGLVAGKPVVGGEAVKAIREGYPAEVLKEASGFLGVSESRIFKAVHVAPTTANRLFRNEARIDAAITERVYRMGNTTRMAIEVFEDAERAAAWMREPNKTLGGVAPLELMDTEPGAISVRQVLNAIATGGVA